MTPHFTARKSVRAQRHEWWHQSDVGLRTQAPSPIASLGTDLGYSEDADSRARTAQGAINQLTSGIGGKLPPRPFTRQEQQRRVPTATQTQALGSIGTGKIRHNRLQETLTARMQWDYS